MNAKRTAKAKEIILAALKLFAVKGYGATSVEEIAAAAGIGKSTIYEYYTTKEELFVEAVQAGAELLMEDLQSIESETRDPMQRLRNIAGLFFKEKRPEFSLESKLFIDLLSQILLNDGAFSRLKQMTQDLYRMVVRKVVDFLLAGVSLGQLKPQIASDAEKIAINYLAYLEGIKVHSMLAGHLVNAPEQIDFYLAQLSPLILKGDAA